MRRSPRRGRPTNPFTPRALTRLRRLRAGAPHERWRRWTIARSCRAARRPWPSCRTAGVGPSFAAVPMGLGIPDAARLPRRRPALSALRCPAQALAERGYSMPVSPSSDPRQMCVVVRLPRPAAARVALGVGPCSSPAAGGDTRGEASHPRMAVSSSPARAIGRSSTSGREQRAAGRQHHAGSPERTDTVAKQLQLPRRSCVLTTGSLLDACDARPAPRSARTAASDAGVDGAPGESCS